MIEASWEQSSASDWSPMYHPLGASPAIAFLHSPSTALHPFLLVLTSFTIPSGKVVHKLLYTKCLRNLRHVGDWRSSMLWILEQTPSKNTPKNISFFKAILKGHGRKRSQKEAGINVNLGGPEVTDWVARIKKGGGISVLGTWVVVNIHQGYER